MKTIALILMIASFNVSAQSLDLDLDKNPMPAYNRAEMENKVLRLKLEAQERIIKAYVKRAEVDAARISELTKSIDIMHVLATKIK